MFKLVYRTGLSLNRLRQGGNILQDKGGFLREG